MAFDPHIAVVAVLTSGVGYLMIVAGLHKSMLELRSVARKCPSCGRVVQERVCSSCAAG